jgi:hypothetical protein
MFALSLNQDLAQPFYTPCDGVDNPSNLLDLPQIACANYASQKSEVGQTCSHKVATSVWLLLALFQTCQTLDLPNFGLA